MTPEEIRDLIARTLSECGERPGTYESDANDIINTLKLHNLYIVGGGAIMPRPHAPGYEAAIVREREEAERAREERDRS